jgi:hypothetical protein
MLANRLSSLRWMIRPQESRPELRIETFLGHEVHGFLCELDLYVLNAQAPLCAIEEEPRYVGYLLPAERAKDGRLVYAVHELRP